METCFSGDQNTGRVRIPNGRKSSNWWMVWFSNDRQPLENRTSKAQISHKLDHSVRYSNDRPFEKRTIKCTIVSGIQMYIIWIPTVLINEQSLEGVWWFNFLHGGNTTLLVEKLLLLCPWLAKKSITSHFITREEISQSRSKENVF